MAFPMHHHIYDEALTAYSFLSPELLYLNAMRDDSSSSSASTSTSQTWSSTKPLRQEEYYSSAMNQMQELPPHLTPSPSSSSSSLLGDKVISESSSSWAAPSYDYSYTSSSSGFSSFLTAEEAEDLRTASWETELSQLLSATPEIEEEYRSSHHGSDSSISYKSKNRKKRSAPHEITCIAYGDAQWDWERLFGKSSKERLERKKEEQARMQAKDAREARSDVDVASLAEVATRRNGEIASRRMQMYLRHLGRADEEQT